MNDGQSLQRIHHLLADVSDPAFIWQVVALLTCVLLATLIARWRAARHREGVARLADAGARLVFPLSGMVLSGVAILICQPFIPVNVLKLAMPLFGSMALVRSMVFVLRQAFPAARWLAAWERIIAATVWGWMALYITDLAPYVIGAFEQVSFTIGKQRVDLWMILNGIATVFLTVIAALWVAGAIEQRLMRIDSLDGNLRLVGVRVAKAALTVIAIISSLALVGIDMTALSVFTGALGVGLGFGLQKIASNYVSGFIILLDRSIRMGNIVQLGAESGVVSQITTRYTVLRNPGGVEFIVPNETFISSVVQNQTYTDTSMRLTTQVGVAYDTDLEKAMQLMQEAAVTQPRVLADPPPRVLLTQFADSSITLELGFWIADPDQGKMNVVSEVNLAIWKSFKAHGIQIPYPQREVRVLNSPEPA